MGRRQMSQASSSGRRKLSPGPANMRQENPNEASLSLISKTCPRCHWSGDPSLLFADKDGEYHFDRLPACRFSPTEQYKCLCCSVLAGFLAAMNLSNNGDAAVWRNNGCLTYVSQKGSVSKDMILCTIKGSDPDANIFSSIPHLNHLPYGVGDTSSHGTLVWVK